MSSVDPASGLPSPRIELDEVDSTNLEVMRRAVAGERGPLWISARHQTAGRGRSGRTWQSTEGNLVATFLLEPGCAPAALHQLSLVAGVAVHRAVARICPALARSSALVLKWPNDLMSGHAKLGGILVESSSAASDLVAAIGIGVNVVAAPAIPDRATTSLAELGCLVTRDQVLDALDGELRDALEMWDSARGFARVRTAWLERAGPLGQPVCVDTGSERVTGAYAGLDETGALLVDSVATKPGELRRFTFGDVSLLAPRQTEGSTEP